MRGEAGVSLAELLVGMTIMAVVSALTLSMVLNVYGGLGKVTSDSIGLNDVQNVQERMSRDLRVARAVDAGATESQVSIWIDSNSDYVRTANEVVTWRLIPDPNDATHFQVLRQQGTATSQIIGHTLVSQLAFTYDSPTDVTKSSVVTVDMQYDAKIGKYTNTHHVDFAVKLRNYG